MASTKTVSQQERPAKKRQKQRKKPKARERPAPAPLVTHEPREPAPPVSATPSVSALLAPGDVPAPAGGRGVGPLPFLLAALAIGLAIAALTHWPRGVLSGFTGRHHHARHLAFVAGVMVVGVGIGYAATLMGA